MKINDFVFSISSITSADVIEVKSLEQEGNLSPWAIEDYYAEIDRLDSIALVAKVKNKVIGFVIARLIRTDNKKLTFDIEIYNICVTSKHRRKGIGQSLIKKLNRATGNKTASIWLEVRESNEKAVLFYSNLGFTVVGIRNNFYHDPIENGLVMKKSFD